VKIIVLLSAGRDPQSGVARPVQVDLQAIALARCVAGAKVIGSYAGASDEAVLDALGHGLRTLTLLRIDTFDDPSAALAAEIARIGPDLILTGRRGRGGSDSGLLPYK
jgi:electron transfer flavoprotein beta subunit